MQKKLLFFIKTFLLLMFFPLTSYSYFAIEDPYSSFDDGYSSQQVRHQSSYRTYADEDDYYSPPAYYDNDSYQSYSDEPRYYKPKHRRSHSTRESHHERLPATISPPGEKVVIVDPRVHGWGAYDADGHLVREGLASAGSSWCRDLHRACHTSVGSFRIQSLGSSDCFSRRFPLGRGGAPMPYCMYFNKNQALHGSYELAEANISHGCVRMHVDDAEWLRFNFVHIGTKVIIKPY